MSPKAPNNPSLDKKLRKAVSSFNTYGDYTGTDKEKSLVRKTLSCLVWGLGSVVALVIHMRNLPMTMPSKAMAIAVAIHGMSETCSVFSGPYEWGRARASPPDWCKRSSSSWKHTNIVICFFLLWESRKIFEKTLSHMF